MNDFFNKFRFLVLIACLVFETSMANTVVKIDYLDKYFLTGIEYKAKRFIPTPFVGVWGDQFYNHVQSSNKNRGYLQYEFSPFSATELYMSVTVHLDETSATFRRKIDLTDWTVGYSTDPVWRQKIIDEKFLLDYEKPVIDQPNGPIPEGLVIRKFLIGMYEGSKVYFIVYTSESLDLIKKYHRIPAIVLRVKDDDYWYKDHSVKVKN